MNDKRSTWLEWAVYNLARGSALADVTAEMAAHGFGAGEMEAELQALKQHPAFRAALRLGRDINKLTSLNNAVLELERQVYDVNVVPRISSLSAQEFHQFYYVRNWPVVIEDVVAEWPAMRKWDLKYLRERFGSELVAFQRGRSPADHRDSFVDHTTETTFAEFLDLIQRPPPGEAPPYLIAHDRLLERPPFDSLLQDLRFDPRFFDPDGPKGGRVFLWLGGPGTMTPLHRDLSNVYLAQIHGQKWIRMVPSKQLHLVYNESGYHSEADFDQLDYQQFPLLKDAWIMETVLKPGDLLFIPIGWWHFVKSLDITISITGNNFAYPNTFAPIF